MRKSVEIDREVKDALMAIREGDLSLSAELYRHGDQVIKYISPWLSDGDEVVRIEAVMILNAVESEASVNALVDALSDSSGEVRERSSRSVYKYLCNTRKKIRLESELIEGVKLGYPSAAALLLLGFTENGEQLLLKYKTETRLVKLFQYGPAIPAGLPAMVALSRLGSEHARLSVDTNIRSGDIKTLKFLLQAIDSIDSPVLLHSLANQTLSDLREIIDPEMLVHAEPARRVADMAVNIFVKRLQLKPSFELTTSRRYEAKDFENLLRLIRAAIPR